MSDITENIKILKNQLPPSVRLVAVSKTRPESDILEAYNAGQRIFGENRVQEILRKKDQLPGDIEWHLIGHLQTNKVKAIVPFVSMIHSVDSYRLLSSINSESSKSGKVTDCLLQVHIADEETKSGFLPEELLEELDSHYLQELNNVRICGLMGMATFTDDSDKVRNEFRSLAGFFNKLRTEYFHDRPYFTEISMGMSGDYEIAVEEGSTMIRVGSLIFGERIKK
jgi:pyridoxal phosphate enzyme (YggS family)